VEVVISTSSVPVCCACCTRVQEGLRAHDGESIDTGADQKKRKLLDALVEARTDGAG